ncbi:MarR family winged helix-turn-helix transcriptional regulator [Costertonia aggregata]|uniref:MarR family transcriptional regulator n=1 Tax=Costertonia aggregata TaxID=343403 RepID=A0A7H9ALV1_9FLAO|nr:MarR family transcriptional regulator [Costertonia aggregata]QLG44255.1 MarR family transcriptional regulator [Costertonia aggregata]
MNVESIIKTDKVIPLHTRTIIHLLLINQKIHETMATALKPFEVSQQQFNVLRILKGQKGKPSNLSTLNERMVTKMSNTTRLVDKLLAKNYVQRTICEHNRRKVEITLTKKGSEVLTQMSKIVNDAEKELLKNFSKKELEHLNSLMDKF